MIWLEDPCSIICLSGEENSELSLLMRYFIYCWTTLNLYFTLNTLVNFVLIINWFDRFYESYLCHTICAYTTMVYFHWIYSWLWLHISLCVLYLVPFLRVFYTGYFVNLKGSIFAYFDVYLCHVYIRPFIYYGIFCFV